MGVKRFDLIQETATPDPTAWLEECYGGKYALSSDYDALAADRDQISLTLAVAKADRDKWFNRARDLEKAINRLLEGVHGWAAVNEAKALLAASTPETGAKECACMMPFDKTPGKHHSPICPMYERETSVQHVCACEVHECHKGRLKSNEYCHDDRKAGGLAQSDRGSKP